VFGSRSVSAGRCQEMGCSARSWAKTRSRSAGTWVQNAFEEMSRGSNGWLARGCASADCVLADCVLVGCVLVDCAAVDCMDGTVGTVGLLARRR